MSGLLQHLKVSAIPDGADASQVQPSDWNAAHVLTGGNHGAIPVRDLTDATYGGNWLASVASGYVLASNGVGALPAWSSSLSLAGSLTIGSTLIVNQGPVILGGLGDSVNGLALVATGGGRPILDFKNSGGLLAEFLGSTNLLQLYVGPTLTATFSLGVLTLNSVPDSGSGLVLNCAGAGRPGMEFRNAATGMMVQILATDARGLQCYTNGGSTLGLQLFANGDLTLAGKLEAPGGIYKSGTAYIHPKWALEHGFTGSITRFVADAVANGVTDYAGRLPLDEAEDFARQHYDLPLMARDPHGDLFQRGDLLLASVEEAYLHLFDLHHRLEALEHAKE
jgi:hypothetical protein